METLEQKLKELNKNETAKEVLEYLSLRTRHRNITNLNNLYYAIIKHGSKLKQDEYNKLFIELGKMDIGRKIGSNRFRWFYDVKDVGAVATGDLAKLERLQETVKRPRVSFKRRSVTLETKKPTVSKTLINLEGKGWMVMVDTDKGEQVKVSLDQIFKIADQLR